MPNGLVADRTWEMGRTAAPQKTKPLLGLLAENCIYWRVQDVSTHALDVLPGAAGIHMMDKQPPILLQICPDGIKPYDHLSGLQMSKLITGQVLTATPRKGRTLPRNGAYWAGLHTALAATDAWPTEKHLHEDLKRLTGYVDIYHNPLTGRDEIRPQSTAFNAMPESEFAQFFKLAQMKFIARMGFDPWARVEA